MPRLDAPDEDIERQRTQGAVPPGERFLVPWGRPAARAPLPLLIRKRDETSGAVESSQASRVRENLYDCPFGVVCRVGTVASTLLPEKRSPNSVAQGLRR